MNSSLRFVNHKRSLALVMALCFGLAHQIGNAAEAPAADEVASAATPPPVEELVTLDEVWVRGKSLTRLIEDAENAFFARYNALNRDDKFDVHCGDIALHRGSMIMTRTCLPGFIADRATSPAYPLVGVYYRPPTFSLNPTCYGPVTTAGGYAHYEGGCFGTPADRDDGRTSTYANYYTGYQAPSLELEAMHRRQEYADTVISVIGSDPQLLEMAEELALLYADLEMTQQHYRAARKARFQARPTNFGPRVPAPRQR